MRRLLFVAVVLVLLQGNLGLDSEQETETHVVTVDSTNLRFTPSTLTVNEGDTIRFVWGGQALPHNAVEENGVFDSGDPERELDYGHVFGYESAGTYDFFCEPHEGLGMVGSVTVQDVETPVNTSQSVGTATNDSSWTNNGQFFLAMGILGLFTAAMWRARIYD